MHEGLLEPQQRDLTHVLRRPVEPAATTAEATPILYTTWLRPGSCSVACLCGRRPAFRVCLLRRCWALMATVTRTSCTAQQNAIASKHRVSVAEAVVGLEDAREKRQKAE